MSQEQQDATDYVRVTLTIHEFSEDGECCIVSDKHGHGTELSTDAFLHDAEDIDVGDTIACDILREAWEDTGLIPDDAGPHDVRACGREKSPPAHIRKATSYPDGIATAPVRQRSTKSCSPPPTPTTTCACSPSRKGANHPDGTGTPTTCWM